MNELQCDRKPRGWLRQAGVHRIVGVAFLLMGCLVGTPAQARETIVAPGVSPLEVLLIKDQIRQRWVDYHLFITGDGFSRDQLAWAADALATDARWLWFAPDGEVIRNLGSMEEQRENQIRLRARRVDIGRPNVFELGPGREIPGIVKFDQISATQVKTRTFLILVGMHRPADGAPDGVPAAAAPGVPTMTISTYHDTWVKQDGRWVKFATTIYTFAGLSTFMATSQYPAKP